jgi:hypothetical protein
MTTITIKQKQSCTGTIYDLASDQYDRVIDFGTRYRFAVVLPAYYNIRITRHRTVEAAIKQFLRLARDYSGVRIVGNDGRSYSIKPCQTDLIVD